MLYEVITELCTWGDHINVSKADQAYCDNRRALLDKYGLKLFTISTHLDSQCVCDPIDQRHKNVASAHVWGDGDPEGVRQRAAEEMVKTAEVAKRLGINT